MKPIGFTIALVIPVLLGWGRVAVEGRSIPEAARDSSVTTVREPGVIDFRNDVMPIFTKYGCNSGGCHGAAIGRGGFPLSLYGGDPEADHESIVRQLEGRRVNLAHPEKSLILLKPTSVIEHGGGVLLDDEDEATQILRDWIAQGAVNASSRTLERIDVTPGRHVFESLGQSVQLRASACYTDGTTRDVTNWTVFSAEDSSAVDVDSDSAEVRVLRRGRHIVIARYMEQVVSIEFLIPLSETAIDLTSEPRLNIIDEAILDTLATLRLPPSPPADDPTFLRRVTLDLTGQLPTPERVEAFLSDDASDKRVSMVDELLNSDAFNTYWTLQLAKLFRVGTRTQDDEGTRAYHEWLADQVRTGTGYAEMAVDLIMATGDTHQTGPANFYRTVGGPREQAEFLSELFLGSRMRCANCHNHPLDRWTQDDYHGLAAFFAKVEGGQVVTINESGNVIHPRTLAKATQRIPGVEFLPDDVSDGRQALATWLTAPDNPYFAKAIVNRLWQRMMGRGLVEPVDDFRATNPATHPELLERLARDFVENGYRIQHTLRRIALSASYARSADAPPENADDDRFYAHASRRPLEPEVLADAISDVLGIADRYGDQPKGTRAVALISPKTPSTSLDILGRCGRDVSCETTTESTGGLTRKLHLFNGGLLNDRIGASGGRLDTLIAAGKTPLEIVDAFYIAALSRHPTDQEQSVWSQQFDPSRTARDQREHLEDLVWGLLVCDEFNTNH